MQRNAINVTFNAALQAKALRISDSPAAEAGENFGWRPTAKHLKARTLTSSKTACR